jgi:hypothetical protein
MSSTRKTLQHISSAKKSPGVVDVAAVHVAADVAAEVAGEAAGAVAAVAVAEAAACPGDIAASARSVHFLTTFDVMVAGPCLSPAWPSFYFARPKKKKAIRILD